MRRFTTGAIATAAAVAAAPALAQPMVVADSGDSAWLLACSVLVLVAAIPGVAMLFGSARARIAQPATLAVGLLLFAALGYSLAFGDGSAVLGGAGNALLANLGDLRVGTTVPESAFVLFQVAAAALALSLLVVPLASRARLGWLLPFAALWLLVVYVPVARWMWGGGWLATAFGALDFAGGLVILTTAGIGGLVAALLLRTRAPADDETGSTASASTGAALVLIGMLGLIGGSVLGAGDDAAAAMLDALLATSGGVAASLAATGIGRRPANEATLVIGALAGLAAITPGAGFVGPAGAALIGVAGALAALGVSRFVRALKIADSASTFAIFASAGLAGALVFPLCVAQLLGGPGYSDGDGFVIQLAGQSVAVLAVTLWTIVASTIAALAVSAVVPMRVSPQS